MDARRDADDPPRANLLGRRRAIGHPETVALVPRERGAQPLAPDVPPARRVGAQRGEVAVAEPAATRAREYGSPVPGSWAESARGGAAPPQLREGVRVAHRKIQQVESCSHVHTKLIVECDPSSRSRRVTPFSKYVDLAAAAPPADAVERRLRRVDQRLHPMAIPGRRGARGCSVAARPKLQCCSCMRAWVSGLPPPPPPPPPPRRWRRCTQRRALAEVVDVEAIRLALHRATHREEEPLSVPPRAVVPVEQQVVLVLADMNDPPQVPRLKARQRSSARPGTRPGLDGKVHRIVDHAGEQDARLLLLPPLLHGGEQRVVRSARPRRAARAPSAAEGRAAPPATAARASPVLGPSAGPLESAAANPCSSDESPEAASGTPAHSASSHGGGILLPEHCYARHI